MAKKKSIDRPARPVISNVAEARAWLWTPYHTDCDGLKGVGVDCGMLIVRTFVDTGMVPPFNPRPYPRDWMMHNREEKYLGFIGKHCGVVQEPGLGDIVLFRYGRVFSHGGIITNLQPLRLIHAYFDRRRVIEEDLMLNADLIDPARKMTFFSLWAEKARA